MFRYYGIGIIDGAEVAEIPARREAFIKTMIGHRWVDESREYLGSIKAVI